MKLKTKSLLVVGFFMLLFLVLLLTTIRPILLEDAIKLDDTNIQRELDTLNNQLISTMGIIKRTNLDWSVWDDTYLYIKGDYPEYPEVNLQKATFENTMLNFMIYLDDKNQLVHQVGYNHENKEFLVLGQEFYKEYLPIVQSKDNEKTHLITTEYGLTVTSFEPVYLSSGEGLSAGTLIVGMIINEQFMEELGKRINIQLTLKEVNKPFSTRTKVEVLNDQKIKGSLFLKDYSENKVYEISYVNNRNYFIQKRSGVNQLSVYIFLTSITTVLLILFLLNRFIVSRIGNLSIQLKHIQDNKEIRLRVISNDRNRDELSDLENSINAMLESLEKKHNEIVSLAYYDSLTMLPNRYYLNKEFHKLAKKSQQNVAILFLDLDGFKRINDSLGHEIGDRLLFSVSDRIAPLISKREGIFSRFGGDEFVIVVNYSHIEDLKKLVQDILIEAGKENKLKTYKTFVTASIGVSVYEQDGTGLNELLQKADIAMYEAKRKGKNQSCFYQDLEIASEYKNILELENDLKFALSMKQLEIHYQPIVCSVDHSILGVEALVRWNHPSKGMISPALFIPIAEETGLMPAIGEWVLKESIKQISSLHSKGFKNLVLSVNVSKTQMKDKSFIYKLDEILTKYNYPPSKLQIEITESVIDSYLNEIQDFSNALKKRDIMVALDDFGVGTSSLLFIKELPIDVIKIDRNFIKNVPRDSFDTILLSGIFEVITALNIDVVVEGIEQEEQVNYIASQYITRLQGFYFSRPLPFSILLEKYFTIT
ncbi:bifunctional diguanylate cyclase/phosphodiesterase [Metabacillus halosaccharovorans]|uniref:bifunctional diguanylate cyclase/phosphodiesterase n=1 Tax=Metabacillus halosaccharovorans TaxID=930124 RepID=UPI00099594C0|nr:EAL domain-containing protein [Metabacillus halosaccharovorans]